MQVKLISMTNDPVEVMWTAARTCYASESPIDMWDKAYETYIDPDNVLTDACEKQEKAHWKLVQKVLNSGHQSIAEHVYFTFAIEGISRACSHQLVRHRAGIVFSQQSQRYVEIKESLQELRDIREHGGVANTAGIVEKYFVRNQDGMSGLKYAELDCLIEYRRLIEEEGMAPEDARAILPNSTQTNITMSVNLRELIHLCNLRLCTRAQKEIRELFKLIKAEVVNVQPRLAKYLVPTCEINGICFEHQCCGRKPHIDEVMAVYNAFKDDYISKEDYEQLQDSINNPKVNEKLKSLMKNAKCIK